MNIQAFSERFIKIYEDIDATGLSWDDETSYFTFHSHMEDMVENLKISSDIEKAVVFNSEVGSLTSEMNEYRQDLRMLTGISQTQTERIMLMNRLDFLIFQQIQKMPLDINIVHFTVADKLLQAALATGLNGPQHELYLEALLDKDTLTHAVYELSKTRPFVDKYGKKVSSDDKQTVSELEPNVILELWRKSLGETPLSIINKIPEYRKIFSK